MRRSVSSYISNTRRSVSSDIQTRKSKIPNTRRSVSSDIQTSRSNISNTRRRVFHVIYQTSTSKLEKLWYSGQSYVRYVSYEAQKCLVVRRFKIPVKGWAEAFLAKFCAPIWCAEVTCRSSVLQVDTCSATLQKITSFLRKLLLYFRWYRLGRRPQFII